MLSVALILLHVVINNCTLCARSQPSPAAVIVCHLLQKPLILKSSSLKKVNAPHVTFLEQKRGGAEADHKPLTSASDRPSQSPSSSDADASSSESKSASDTLEGGGGGGGGRGYICTMVY